MIFKARGMSSVIGRLYSEEQGKRLHVWFLKLAKLKCVVLEARTFVNTFMFVAFQICRGIYLLS
jgi:hypothetical protein